MKEKVTTIRISMELDEKLSSYARREELSKNQVVKRAIRNLVEAPENNVPKFGTATH